MDHAVKTVCIMQPTYLPWCGFMDMIDQADLFVLLDTVAISRQSWQTRNRILDRGGNVVWMSVPVKAHMGQPLGEVEISQDGVWNRKHSRTLSALGAYAIWDLLECYEQLPTRLVEFTGRTLQILCRTLGLRDQHLRWASSLDIPETSDPVKRVQAIFEATDATEMLATQGSRDYGVPTRWHDYEPYPYPQNGGPFIPYMSVVDCLARHGPERTLDTIWAGRQVLSL